MDRSSNRNSSSSGTPNRADKEEELLKRVCRGDRDAFVELAEPYRDRLYATVFRLLGNREDAAEICQEAMLRTFWKITGFRGKASFYTWLTQIALNLCYRRLETNRREVSTGSGENEQSERADAGAGILDQAADPAASPRDQAIIKERTALVRRAFSLLSPDDFEILVLREFEDLSYDELSLRLGIPEGTVMSRLHRARTALAAHLRKLGIAQ